MTAVSCGGGGGRAFHVSDLEGCINMCLCVCFKFPITVFLMMVQFSTVQLAVWYLSMLL